MSKKLTNFFVDSDFRQKFDTIIAEHGFTDRSEAIRAAMRLLMEKLQGKETKEA